MNIKKERSLLVNRINKKVRTYLGSPNDSDIVWACLGIEMVAIVVVVRGDIGVVVFHAQSILCVNMLVQEKGERKKKTYYPMYPSPAPVIVIKWGP